MHAVLDGICRGAFNPYKWVEANRENFLDLNEDIAGRFDFLGEEVTTDKVNKYLQKNCHGMSNASFYKWRDVQSKKLSLLESFVDQTLIILSKLLTVKDIKDNVGVV
jgi:hypothetical protein